jgi:hypothetical protein
MARTQPAPNRGATRLGKITVYITALDKYARALDMEDRTALWIDLAERTNTWTQAAFQAIGKHGLNSAAVELSVRGVAAASQQSQRDALIDRLESAKLVEQPQHRAATELVLQSLAPESVAISPWPPESLSSPAARPTARRFKCAKPSTPPSRPSRKPSATQNRIACGRSTS